MNNNVLTIGLVLVCALATGCTCDSNPTHEAIAPFKVDPAKQQPEPDILATVPKLKLDSVVPDIKKMSALKENSNALKFRAQNKYDEAINAFVSALQYNPSNLAVRYNLAVTLVQQKKEAEALAILQQFQDTKNCTDCFIMLAKAKDDPLLKGLGTNSDFQQLVDGPAAKLQTELNAANWIQYDAKALGEQKVAFTLNGFPAISKDGKRISVPRLGHDSDGKITSLTMQTFDPTSGEKVHGQRIMFEEEGNRIYTGKMKMRDMAHLLNNRIEHFHKAMIGRPWEKIPVAVVNKNISTDQCGALQQIVLSDQIIQFTYPNLKITTPDKKILFEGNVAEWSKSENRICSTHPFIRSIYLHSRSQTVLFDLGYCSNACLAPNGRWVSIQLK